MSVHAVYRLLLDFPNRCKGARDEGFLSIESAPDRGGVRVKVEIQVRTCVNVSAEEKDNFLQGGTLLSGLQGPIPGDLDEFLTRLEGKLRDSWGAGEHGNISIRAIPHRKGMKKLIFLEPRNTSVWLSSNSIDFCSK